MYKPSITYLYDVLHFMRKINMATKTTLKSNDLKNLCIKILHKFVALHVSLLMQNKLDTGTAEH